MSLLFYIFVIEMLALLLSLLCLTILSLFLHRGFKL